MLGRRFFFERRSTANFCCGGKRLFGASSVPALSMGPSYPKTFDKILIANRGEIARRVIRTCRDMGIKTVAVYSDADMNSMFVREADEAYRIGPPPSSQSYLMMDKILAVAQQSGAQAVHPGYGFLSENYRFQELLQKNSITFIGPPKKAIIAMGDKIESKKLATEAKVNTVPGYLGEVEEEKEILKIANDIGYPVMIKASAGGGGKGMRIAMNDQEAVEGFKLSKEEAISSFGDGRIFIEKYIEDPRHIEFQILGDEHGNYVYLPERECSVQRRNQKVIEEAPSSAMDEATRHKMGTQAVQLAQACGYFSTGTVEFLMDKNKDFYFLEMNTRLQVEHPITEEITGVDLVEQQLLIAAGHKLNFNQKDIKIHGHSMEYRVYAEDPARKFLPSIGFLKKYKEPNVDDPARRVRIDTGVEEGSEISMYYDPMISKLITWGKDREESMRVLDKAFDEYIIQGVTHNIEFGKSILASEDYWTGNYSTAFIPTNYPDGFKGDPLHQDQLTQVVVAAHQIKNIYMAYGKADAKQPQAKELYVSIDLESTGEGVQDFRVVQSGADSFELTNMATGQSQTLGLSSFDFSYNSLVSIDIADQDAAQFKFNSACTAGLTFQFQVKGNLIDAKVYEPQQYAFKEIMPVPQKIDYAKIIMSPMPGAIVEVLVKEGDSVVEGQQLCIIEAMKMQNILKSEVEGKVKKVLVKGGDSVAVDELLIELE